MPGGKWNLTASLRPRPGLDGVRAKVLHSATEHVESVGLSLGVDEALIEKLTTDAGVTTAQFAQIWPTRDAFLTDLLCELANQAQIDRADSETLLSTWQYLSMRVDDFHSIEGRRRVLIDVTRSAAEYNFDAVTASSKWRTYAALSVTILSWPEGDARTRVLDALRASELSFVETMESFYRNVLPTIGYRLKPVFKNDYQPFVVAAASVIEGLGIVRTTVPALVEAHFDLPVENGVEAWSVASLAFMGVVDAFIEPDPAFVPEEGIERLSGGIDVTPQSQSD
ncbi:hypothetical protein [Cryobacterium tepidiphilum]|uniref:TetR/AcrR family transcriptional regulator n=1 Tax=Cryobacterium tepidiphilum TaxID=2486026 RepID=A0A3M8LFV1_9MICO|nr:hypothetical protein [Cryobacterium tepidiphilum]RNE64205.1 hypothetical protein EEJ31_04915 [Cryobacterium tepidiphilum]